MSDPRTLLMTDIVDSTQLNERLGDATMGCLWEVHDTLARELIRTWAGQELGRSDGFLVLFAAPAQAAGFALAYHRMLAGLAVPLRARVGLHHGSVTLRENRSEDTSHGAIRFEVDGVALPVTARVMSAALGGQTLVTGAAVQALGATDLRVVNHGHWRCKGLAEPIELFEIGRADAPFVAPADTPKAYRVVRQGELWAALSELPNNLPAERDSFIGRGRFLGALGRAFDDGARLVTLLGIGGVGKTRLALTYARSWMGDYPGGAWFCDLNAARSLDGIAHAAMHGLQVPAVDGDPLHRLGAAIAGRGPCLVILDTFEQVARFAETTLGAWLEHAPEARFLVTSREVLGISGEHTIVLTPLDADEAAQLFRRRIDAAGLRSVLQPADEGAIPSLMELLDRLPLAIELAAARARLMRPGAMLQRMGERFRLLVRRGERQDRQTTLRATFDWSWELLAPTERLALAQLSVFEGGIGLDAAEAVIAPSLGPGDGWVPDLLQALIEKSLLRSAGAHRFDMLRAAHDYAAERLPGEAAAGGAQARHWRHFATIAEAQATAERGADVDNVVTACRRAAVAEPAVAVALLRNAWAVLRLTGPFTAAVDLGLAVEAGLAPADGRHAVVHRIIGAALMLAGDFAGARERFVAAERAAVACADADTLAQTQCAHAQLELACGDTDAAARLLHDVRQSAAAQANPEVRTQCLNGLGKLHMLQSQWAASRDFYSQALALAEASGDRRWQGGLHGNLGMIARAEGRRADARHHWQTALRWTGEVGDRQWAGNNHCNLGLLLHELGETAAAWDELQTALDIARAIGHPRLEATALCNLGLIEEARGAFEAARACHASAAQVAQSLGDRHLEGQARGYLGLALSLLGRHEAAATELQRAQDVLRPLGNPSATALALLQLALARAESNDAEGAAQCVDSAQMWLTRMADGVDPEVAGMLARAERRLALPASTTAAAR